MLDNTQKVMVALGLGWIGVAFNLIGGSLPGGNLVVWNLFWLGTVFWGSSFGLFYTWLFTIEGFLD